VRHQWSVGDPDGHRQHRLQQRRVWRSGSECREALRISLKSDAFVTDDHGVILTAAWEPAFADWWRGWWQINGGRSIAGAPVHALSRSADKDCGSQRDDWLWCCKKLPPLHEVRRGS